MPFSKLLYELVGRSGQPLVDRLRYRTGFLPRVAPGGLSEIRGRLFPNPYRAAIVISADFELAWAWRYVKGVSNPRALALQKARQTRANLPALLDLFEHYDAPVTWATVGHLFLKSCDRQNAKPHSDLSRPPYFENEFWTYKTGDWLDADPCSNVEQDPAWYAPDLIQMILSAQLKHEIACHTFSHIDCSDTVCPSWVMDSELAECRRIANEWGLALESFVFPGNLGGNLASLKRNGFTACRWHTQYELGLPIRDEHGLWHIPGGIQWEKPDGWSVDAWIRALCHSIDKALETRTVLSLWFHPSCDAINVTRILPAMLEYIATKRGDLWVTTMSNLVARINTDTR